MSYSLGGLTTYTDQNKFPLLRKSLLGAKTATIMNKQLGVKGATTLNILDEDATLMQGGCGFQPTGSSTISQRTITPALISVQKKWCIPDLNAYFTKEALTVGSYNPDFPFGETFFQLQTDYINQELEKAYWQGDTRSATNNLKYFNGFLQVVSASAAFITGSVKVSSSAGGASAITSSNVISILDGIYANIPAQILDKPDTAIFVGFDVFRVFTTALKNANLYNYAVNTSADFEIILPGTTIPVIALHGLNGTYQIVSGRKSNFYIGMDLESDTTNFDFWFSQDQKEYRMNMQATLGTQVAFPSEIVLWYNAQP